MLFGLNYTVVWTRWDREKQHQSSLPVGRYEGFYYRRRASTGVCCSLFYAFSSSHHFYYTSLFRSLSRKLNIKYKLCWASRMALQTHSTKKWRTNFRVMSNGVIERGKTYCHFPLPRLIIRWMPRVLTLTWNIRKTN